MLSVRKKEAQITHVKSNVRRIALKKKKTTYNGIQSLFVLFCIGLLIAVYWKFASGDVYRIRYPLSYEEIVEKYALSNDIDKYLVYSIIRAESYYDKDAVSAKGACGLMQITPDTGSWIAEKMGIKDFSQEDLFDPEKNIMMGVWYFKYLLNRFDGDLKVAIAAYNAGPTNASRWLKREDLSGDGKTLDEIPFDETKKYEQKIMNAYEMYKKIYEQNL
ncbi:MAG: lytic transglycosylase domain-containing protein [Clostridia bacterium]|nr:lytic transglycosylase domain-containing protein [Clostridia bacterium]